MSLATIELAVADAGDLALGLLLAPTWSINLNGSPVITPANAFLQPVNAALQSLATVAALIGAPNILPVSASTVEFEFSQDWPISNYPQEQGAFQAYDKVTLPFEVRLKLTCQGDGATRQAFLSTCLAIANSFKLFDVVTPEMVFTSVNCTHIDWSRTAQRGATLIAVDLWFSFVPVTGMQNFTTTAQPGESAPQSLGNQQPTTPSQYVQSGFASGNYTLQ